MKAIERHANRELQNPTSQSGCCRKDESKNANRFEHLTDRTNVVAGDEYAPDFARWLIAALAYGRNKPSSYEQGNGDSQPNPNTTAKWTV